MEEEQPQLKGVVIISLPPPDNPSKGKTITAFTLSDHHHHHHHHHHHGRDLLPSRSSAPQHPPARRSLLFSKRTLATIVVVATLAWVCLSSEAPLQLLREPADDDLRREENSFWLPLYHKSERNRTLLHSPEIKLGSINSAGVSLGSESQKSSSELSSYDGINSSALFPLRGNLVPDGQYYTSIVIGNPPTTYYLDVDTGSDLTWIQCDAPCTSCAKGPHPLYKPSKGKIVPPRDSLCLEVQRYENYKYCDSCQQCDYEIKYADHSSSMGVLAMDDMHLTVANGNHMKLNFVFGCAYDQQGLLLASPAKTDGILGLNSAKVSLPSQLANQGLFKNVVGHCISSKAGEGGYIFVGDEFVPRWGMTWVPALGSLTNFYGTEVMKLSYGGRQLGVGGLGESVGQVVFDTGSTYTYFTNEVYTDLINSLKSVSDVLVRDDSDPTLPVCWRADFPNRQRSVEDVKQFFKPLTLQFRKRWWVLSTALTIPPEGYLIISNKGNVCLGVLNGGEVHDGSTIILGDVSLRGKLVVYDNVQQMIGWVQSDCAKPQKPRGFPFLL